MFTAKNVSTIQKIIVPISIFGIALLVRIIYNKTTAHNYASIFDAGIYDAIASNIINKHCYCIYHSYQTVSRAPLWPLIITGIYTLTGAYNSHVRLFYCFLGSGTCLFVYFFAKNLFGKYVALIVGILAAVYTGLFIYDGWLYTESLYTFCLTGFTYSLFQLQQRYQTNVYEKNERKPINWYMLVEQRWVLFCGLFLAAMVLTRPNGVSLIGVLVLWSIALIVSKVKPWKTVTRDAIVCILITCILVAPWTYRNYTVSHQFVLVATGAGEVLLGAYNDNVISGDPVSPGVWYPPSGAVLHDTVGYTPKNDQMDTSKALAWIRTHKRDMPYLLGLHIINMWKPYTYSFGLPIEQFPTRLSSRIIALMIPLQSIPIFLLAALGLLVTWKKFKKKLLPVYLVLAYTIAQNVVFYSSMRFRAPIEPLLVLLVGGAFYWLVLIFSKHTSLRRPLS